MCYYTYMLPVRELSLKLSGLEHGLLDGLLVSLRLLVLPVSNTKT